MRKQHTLKALQEQTRKSQQKQNARRTTSAQSEERSSTGEMTGRTTTTTTLKLDTRKRKRDFVLFCRITPHNNTKQKHSSRFTLLKIHQQKKPNNLPQKIKQNVDDYMVLGP